MSTELTTQQSASLATINEGVKFSWLIPENGLECKKSVGGLTDYIVNVHWRYQAEIDGKLVDEYGVHSFEEKVDGDFIPFEDLTLETVTGWLETAMLENAQGHSSLDQIKERLCMKLLEQLYPPIVRPSLPWVKPEPIVEETTTNTEA